jgi:Outer membrane receptor for ferrienterochelin and colicins
MQMKSASVEKVLEEIKQQCDYDFIYDYEYVKELEKVDIDFNNASLDEVLYEVLKNTNLDYRVKDKMIVLFPREVMKPKVDEKVDISVQQEKKTIKGKVTDKDGTSLPGVSVVIKGTNNGVATDIDGNYSLEIEDANAVLVFSFVGMLQQEINYTGQIIQDVTLTADTEQIDEIIVTGYQTISQERVSGSFDIISQKELNRPVTDVSTSLQGLIPGVQATENLDGSMNFMIRGASSIYASTKPLIVVDGFPITGSDFSTINPNDVESITVLKDAAAASIWGARSANGVIVVTTKRPKSGKNQVKIEANFFTKISNMIDLDHVLDQASSADHVRYEKEAYSKERWNYGDDPYFPSFDEISSPLTLAQEFMFANRYNELSTEEMNASLDSLSRISNRKQLQDHFLRNAVVNQATINLTAVTDRARMYGSVLYEGKKDGIIRNGYDRYLMNFNNQFDATDFLKIMFGVNVQYKETNSSGPTIAEMQQLSPYETLIDPDGSYSTNINTYNREQLSLLPLNSFPYSDWSYNLLQEVRNRKITNEELSVRAQLGLNMKIFKGVNLESKFQYERIKTDDSNYQGEETFFTRNMINSYVEYDDATKTVNKQYLPEGGILRENNSNFKSYVIRNQININRDITSDLNLNAILGNEVSSYLTETEEYPWVYGYFPDINQTSVPPYGYGNWIQDFQGNWIESLEGGFTEFGWNKDKYVSFYGNMSLDYKSKYVFTLSVRSDASNYVTDDASLRWSPLWSVGGLWHMSEEPFMKNVNVIDKLSVRFTFGKNGNAEKSTSTKPLLSISNTPSSLTGTTIATIADNGNPSLRWEKTSTTNLGIDFSMFNGRLFGKLDFYNKLGKDITGTIVLPSTTGVTSQRFNNSEIINRGIELELGTKLKFGKATWNTKMTYAYNYNRVKKLFYPSYLVRDLIGTIADPAPVEGKPLSSIWSFTYAGQVDYVPSVVGPGGETYPFASSLYSKTGSDFLTYKGTAIPPHTLGWMNNFSAYGFDLMVVITGKFGGVFREPTFNYPSVGSDKTSVNSFVSDYYNGTSVINYIPSYNEVENFSLEQLPFISDLVSSSSYLECKEINLQYNVPTRLIKGSGLNNLRIFTQVRNLGLIWSANNKNLHPEWLPGTQRPLTTWTFGVNAKF